MELQTRSVIEPLPGLHKSSSLAIEKCLTKYEILGPKGPIVGYCSGHTVYPRTSVQTLETKQRWLREGFQVMANKSPAKALNSPKWGVSKEGTFALYGKWKTEPLDLLRAINGILPKVLELLEIYTLKPCYEVHHCISKVHCDA